MYRLQGAIRRLLSSYLMRPRKIFVLLYRELLKQKLQTKVLLRTNQHFYFLKLLQTLIKQPGPLVSLQHVRHDPR